MQEVWKDIKGFEGLYKISNLGRVKRLISTKCKSERFLSITKDNKVGYCRIMLSKENKQKRFLIHRLLAEHFIPNTQKKPCIDHINGNKSDNRLENLRWCTYKENNNFPLARANNSAAQKKSAQNESLREKRREATKKAMSNPLTRKKISESRKLNWLDPEYVAMQRSKRSTKTVIQFDCNMNFIREFISVNEASRCTGANSSSIIRCCKGIQKTAGKYIWTYKK